MQRRLEPVVILRNDHMTAHRPLCDAISTKGQITRVHFQSCMYITAKKPETEGLKQPRLGYAATNFAELMLLFLIFICFCRHALTDEYHAMGNPPEMNIEHKLQQQLIYYTMHGY